MENHELRVLTLSLNLDIYRVTALNCEAAGGDPVELRLLTEQWAVVSSAGEQGYSRYKRLFFHLHCRLVPEAPMGPTILMNKKVFFDMKGVVHEGGFGADWAVRNGWAVFWKFPYDALSSPLTGVPLLVGEYEMHADAWATGVARATRWVTCPGATAPPPVARGSTAGPASSPSCTSSKCTPRTPPGLCTWRAASALACRPTERWCGWTC